LTQNEIDAAKSVRLTELNVQNQQKIVWPARFVVAKAYIDQLARSQALPEKQITALQKAIQAAENSPASAGKRAKLQGMAPGLETRATSVANPADSNRLRALAEILKHPAA
jgi:hypothetical protein